MQASIPSAQAQAAAPHVLVQPEPIPQRREGTQAGELKVDGFCVLQCESDEETQICNLAIQFYSDVARVQTIILGEGSQVPAKRAQEAQNHRSSLLPRHDKVLIPSKKSTAARPSYCISLAAGVDEVLLAPPLYKHDDNDDSWRTATRTLHAQAIQYVTKVYEDNGVFPIRDSLLLAFSESNKDLAITPFILWSPLQSNSVSSMTKHYGSYVLHIFHKVYARFIQKQVPDVRILGVGEVMILDSPSCGPSPVQHVDTFDPYCFSISFQATPSLDIMNEVEKDLKVLGEEKFHPSQDRTLQGWWSGEKTSMTQPGTRVLQWDPDERQVIMRHTSGSMAQSLAALQHATLNVRITPSSCLQAERMLLQQEEDQVVQIWSKHMCTYTSVISQENNLRATSGKYTGPPQPDACFGND